MPTYERWKALKPKVGETLGMTGVITGLILIGLGEGMIALWVILGVIGLYILFTLAVLTLRLYEALIGSAHTKDSER